MPEYTRREIRDSAMKLLFETALRDDPIEELYAIAEEIDEIIVNEKVRELVDGTLAHRDAIDAVIDKYSPKRQISRISKLTLSILRLAVYEINYDDGYRHGVVVYTREGLHISSVQLKFLDPDFDTVKEYSLIEMLRPDFSDLTENEYENQNDHAKTSLVSLKEKTKKSRIKETDRKKTLAQLKTEEEGSMQA